MKTELTQLFNIKFPVIKSGDEHNFSAQLVADVANAGGLGFLSTLFLNTPQALAEEISKIRQLTNKPFGVNLTISVFSSPAADIEYVQSIINNEIEIVEMAGSESPQLIALFNAAGVKVIQKCSSTEQAIQAQNNGCVAVIIDSANAATKYNNEDNFDSLLLVPKVTEQLSIPVIAGGHFNDAGSLVAAFALGAKAVNIGNRFMVNSKLSIEDVINDLVTQASHVIHTQLRPLK